MKINLAPNNKKYYRNVTVPGATATWWFCTVKLTNPESSLLAGFLKNLPREAVEDTIAIFPLGDRGTLREMLAGLIDL